MKSNMIRYEYCIVQCVPIISRLLYSQFSYIYIALYFLDSNRKLYTVCIQFVYFCILHIKFFFINKYSWATKHFNLARYSVYSLYTLISSVLFVMFEMHFFHSSVTTVIKVRSIFRSNFFLRHCCKESL